MGCLRAVNSIEQRRRADRPQTLPRLPIGVSGRLGKISEVDRYRFTAAQDGPVTVDLMARRLGANFNGVLEVRDAAGRLIADVADTEGLDAQLTFAVVAGETYAVHLFDVDFRGNRAFVYHLSVKPGPRIIGAIPAAGRRDSTREVEFLLSATWDRFREWLEKEVSDARVLSIRENPDRHSSFYCRPAVLFPSKPQILPLSVDESVFGILQE